MRQHCGLGGASTFSWNIGQKEEGALQRALKPEIRARIRAYNLRGDQEQIIIKINKETMADQVS